MSRSFPGEPVLDAAGQVAVGAARARRRSCWASGRGARPRRGRSVHRRSACGLAAERKATASRRTRAVPAGRSAASPADHSSSSSSSTDGSSSSGARRRLRSAASDSSAPRAVPGREVLVACHGVRRLVEHDDGDVLEDVLGQVGVRARWRRRSRAASRDATAASRPSVPGMVPCDAALCITNVARGRGLYMENRRGEASRRVRALRGPLGLLAEDLLSPASGGRGQQAPAVSSSVSSTPLSGSRRMTHRPCPPRSSRARPAAAPRTASAVAWPAAAP